MTTRKYVKTFTSKNRGVTNIKLPSGTNPGTPQSFALIKNELAVVAHNQGNNNKIAHLRKYTKNGYVKNSDTCNQNLGHCNGLAYCNENELLYATGYAGSSNTKKIVVLNTNFKQQFTITLPVAVSGIGYDSTNKKFYCSKGNKLYVFPFSSMKKNASKRTYTSFSTIGGTSQDVGGYGGIVYKVMWHDKYGDIDAYRASNGKYLGSIKIAYSETESVDFTSDGKLVYLTANQNRALHWTNYTAPFGNTSSSNNDEDGDNYIYDEYDESLNLGLQVYPETLFSSANYKYLEEEEESEFSKNSKALKAYIQTMLSSSGNVKMEDGAIPDSVTGLSIRSLGGYKNPKTKVYENVSGANLPSATNYVESPYVEITIGGKTIGTYKKGSYPNYINGLKVKKTNGSLNEYTINLTHQVYPGDNPNYIDNLISATGYNKIKIEYGDANGNIAYQDLNAMITGVKSTFDFFNNRIDYTITATSSAIASAIVRRNYSAVTAKPSSIINSMLYDTEELLQYFPGMANKTVVNYNNLIPENDKEVSLDAQESITPLNYLLYLVSMMSSINNDDSSFYLSIADNSSILNGTYFQIKEIKTRLSSISSQLLYEVNVGYPEKDNNVYNFSVDTNFSWPLAYEYSGKFNTYDYSITSAGDLIPKQNSANIKSSINTTAANVQDKNWWKNVTEFPITANLELKGLSASILLLTYIKINVVYYGNKRSTSGVYIVVGQEDTLTNDGFKTKLNLLRVAGDNQYITVDGRIKT